MKKLITTLSLTLLICCTDKTVKTASLDNKEVLNDSITILENTDKRIDAKKVDSSKIKELKPLFIVKKDDFDEHGWIKPKSKPTYINTNGFYCYFAKNNDGTVENFRFVGQYAADEWLFVKSLKFNIDAKTYDYFPDEVKSDHDSTIWEWFDEQVTPSNLDILEKIASAKNVKVRFIGSEYYDDKTMSQTNIKSIKNTLEYYKALGGKF